MVPVLRMKGESAYIEGVFIIIFEVSQLKSSSTNSESII
jgi:hypothetical protein